MAKKKNPLVFLDVCIEGAHYERMVFELFFDIAPFTAENFRLLCTGEKGSSPKTKMPLCYKDAYFHEVKEGGSYVKGMVEKVYMVPFPVESSRLKHDKEGVLSMAKEDRETRGSHFVITLKDDHSLDSSHVVFGKLVEGFYTLGKIRDTGVRFPVQIFNSGLHYEGDGPWYLWKGQKPAVYDIVSSYVHISQENFTGVLPDGLKSTVQIEGGGALGSDDGKAQRQLDSDAAFGSNIRPRH